MYGFQIPYQERENLIYENKPKANVAFACFASFKLQNYTVYTIHLIFTTRAQDCFEATGSYMAPWQGLMNNQKWKETCQVSFDEVTTGAFSHVRLFPEYKLELCNFGFVLIQEWNCPLFDIKC